MTAYNLSLVAGNVSMAADGNQTCSEEAWIKAPLQSASEQYWEWVYLSLFLSLPHNEKDYKYC